jgi:hypothetical protein
MLTYSQIGDALPPKTVAAKAAVDTSKLSIPAPPAVPVKIEPITVKLAKGVPPGPQVNDPIMPANKDAYRIWWSSQATQDSASKRTTYGPAAMVQHGYGMTALSAAQLEKFLSDRHQAYRGGEYATTFSRVISGQLRDVTTGRTVCEIRRSGFGQPWQTTLEFPGNVARGEVTVATAGITPEGKLIGQREVVTGYVERIGASAAGGNSAARQQLDALATNPDNAGYQAEIDAAIKAADAAKNAITAFDPKLGVWRVAVPIVTSLGEATPVTHTEATTSTEAPAGVPQVALNVYLTMIGASEPFYTRWWFWTAIGIVGVGAGVFIYRRRKTA